jgi:hypothetical protein
MRAVPDGGAAHCVDRGHRGDNGAERRNGAGRAKAALHRRRGRAGTRAHCSQDEPARPGGDGGGVAEVAIGEKRPQSLSPPFSKSIRIACGTTGICTSRMASPRPCSRNAACTPPAASSPKADPPDSTKASTCSTIISGSSRGGVPPTGGAAQDKARGDRRWVEQHGDDARAQREIGGLPDRQPGDVCQQVQAGGFDGHSSALMDGPDHRGPVRHAGQVCPARRRRVAGPPRLIPRARALVFPQTNEGESACHLHASIWLRVNLRSIAGCRYRLGGEVRDREGRPSASPCR